VLHLVGNTRNHRMADHPQKSVVISAKLSQSATAGTSPTSSQSNPGTLGAESMQLSANSQPRPSARH
jgi:hypothetical protein